MPAPRKKKKTTLPLPAAAAQPRWRMLPHPDGVSMAPVRVISRSKGERNQALADMFGDTPLPSTGEGMRPISTLLAEALSHMELSDDSMAPEQLASAWQRAVGNFLSTQSRLVSLADGVAGVQTNHPAVRFELQRNKAIIIQALNAALGEGSVRVLNVRHG